MYSRVLPIINAIGCLAITGLVVVQWRVERVSHRAIGNLQSELATSREQTAEENRRRLALERDIAALKEAVEATQQSAEEATRKFAEQENLAANLQTEITAAREQITAWEAAIKTRDERIRVLDKELAATRQRLDEAIAKLKEAGAR